MHELDIIYQDEHLLVINKPSGLVSVPGKGNHKNDSLSQRVLHHFPSAPSYPAVHRLDMDTSGLILFALNPASLRLLARQFEQRSVKKEYIALLGGGLAKDSGRIELAFRLDPDNRPHQVYDPVQGKLGISLWKVIERRGNVTRVLFSPLTGRTHQLRVHSAHPLGLGVPIIGDTLYGDGQAHGELKLHASLLSFTHPVRDETITLQQAPLW